MVLQTLQEIAAALQYLHRNDVLHGDLTGGNVLLTASDKDTRGFTAKVRGCCIVGCAGVALFPGFTAKVAKARRKCCAWHLSAEGLLDTGMALANTSETSACLPALPAGCGLWAEPGVQRGLPAHPHPGLRRVHVSLSLAALPGTRLPRLSLLAGQPPACPCTPSRSQHAPPVCGLSHPLPRFPALLALPSSLSLPPLSLLCLCLCPPFFMPSHAFLPARACRPPELITEGILTKAADVYAFGVITWEIYVGRWAGGRAGLCSRTPWLHAAVARLLCMLRLTLHACRLRLLWFCLHVY